MIKEMKKIFKKLFTLVIIFSLLSVYLPTPSLISFATDNILSLSTPTNLKWKEGSTATATWDAVENANYYHIIVNVYNENNELMGSENTGTSNNQIDLQQEINEINYNYKLNKMFVSFVVQAAYVENNINITGDYSEESIKYFIEKKGSIKLPTPTNVALDNEYNLTWDIDTTNLENTQYFYVYYQIKYQGSIKTGYLSLFNPRYTPNRDPNYGMIITEGKATANIKNVLATKYKDLGYNGQTIEISCCVESGTYSNSTVYLDSDKSEYSNSVNYKNEGIAKLPTPTNVVLDDEYNLTWDIDTTNLENIQYFYVYYQIKYQGSIKTGYLSLFNPRYTPNRDPNYGMIITEGKATANIKNVLATKYKDLGYNGQTIEISCCVESGTYSNSTVYLDSGKSEYSNSTYYNSAGSTKINSITLSPNKPVIAVGRTMYIGKTIEPDNAYYSSINWSSSDNSIVSIDNMGQITGIQKGNATITAQINNATQNAEVSVYEIESNINDPEESKEVINEANNVIEAVITDGDITNTDITDKEMVINEIEQGAQNGDTFNVDIKYDNKTATEYENIKDKINSEFNGFNIVGGNDIKVEILHTDTEGAEHHIANITELENEVSVKFDMSSNIPELSNTKAREYKLVRCHEESIEPVEFEINNGIIETSSDKFSDFVLLYKDTDLPTFNISGQITSFNSDMDSITVKLYREGTSDIVDEKVVKGNVTNYEFTNVVEGKYIIKFLKKNHVEIEYLVTVNGTNVTQDATICLLGDVNADGKINTLDTIMVLQRISHKITLTDTQELAADTSKDGNINTLDVIKILQYISHKITEF